MASVTKTITETIGEIQKTTSLYFTSFEDFMEYERDVNFADSGATTSVSIVVEEPRVEAAQAPLTKLEVGKKYRITKELHGHGFDVGDVVVVTGYDYGDGEYKVELLDGSDYWYIKPDEV